MSAWKREMAGVYTLRNEPRIQVKTYCECSYSNCLMKWSVYVDDVSGGGDRSMFFQTREFANRAALALADELVSR
jgi:hypothetical protein